VVAVFMAAGVVVGCIKLGVVIFCESFVGLMGTDPLYIFKEEGMFEEGMFEEGMFEEGMFEEGMFEEGIS
jgi:hypothetical protein